MISLLQYMKNTTMNNPEMPVKDTRIIELAEIVEEVKQSEEWEAVKMNILEIGIEKGRNEGKIEGKIEGKAEAILDLLDMKGTVSKELRCRILEQKDIEILRKWLVLAAKVSDVTEFETEME